MSRHLRLIAVAIVAALLLGTTGCVETGSVGAADLRVFEWSRIPTCEEANIESLHLSLYEEAPDQLLDEVASAYHVPCQDYLHFAFRSIPYGDYELWVDGYTPWGDNVYSSRVPVNHSCE